MNLLYADDMIVMAPSASGLQSLLLTCEQISLKLNMIFNVKQTVDMHVSPKSLNIVNPLSAFINCKPGHPYLSTANPSTMKCLINTLV